MGVFGGYPGCTVAYTRFHGSNPAGDVSFPDPSDPEAETEDVVWGSRRIEDDDAVYVRGPGSGGYGDPLARDPERVAADVRRGVVTPESAREVYGVPVTDEGVIDGDVGACRDRIYERRRQDGSDGGFEPPVAADDLEATPVSLGEHVAVLEGADGAYAACGSCEAVLAPVEGWKERTAVTGRPVSAAGLYRDCPEDLQLREFACPACGRLLDTELAFEGDPYLARTVRLDGERDGRGGE